MATPRSTRARSKTPAPLPAVSTKPSAAYGARGKANLVAQVAAGGADFASAFKPTKDPQPEDAAAEDGDEADVAPPKSAAKKGKRKAPAIAEPPNVEEPEAEAAAEGEPTVVVADRSATGLDGVALYQAPDGPQPPPQHPNGLPKTIVMERVSRTRVFMRALPQYVFRLRQSANATIKDAIFGLSVWIVLITLLFWMPVTPSMTARRESFIFYTKRIIGIHPYDLPPTEWENHWHQYKHDLLFMKDFPDYNVPELQWAINMNIYERFERIEASIKNLEGNMTLQRETLDALNEMLPPRLVVQVENGRYEIPEAFWEALQSRLTADHDIGPLWDSYMAANNRGIEHLTQLLVTASIDRVLEERKIVDRAAFIKIVNENNERLARDYGAEFHEMQKQHFSEVKDLALRTTDKHIQDSLAAAMSSQQLANLAKANEIHNAYRALRTVNWFSVGLGARIDPKMTSATQQPPTQSWFESMYRSVSPNHLMPHPPITAIRRWDEATDCWCAARDPTGASQITILTSSKIHPEKFVIEHVPAAGTLNIDAAPRDWEVWAHTSSAKQARKVEAKMDDHMRFFEIECGPRPAPEMVCIAKGTYDIHKDNYVQTQDTFVKTKELGLEVNKFTVRVLSNWGADWTCLYRVRATGEKVGAVAVENEETTAGGATVVID